MAEIPHRTVPRDTVLFEEGDESALVFVVLSGRVRLCHFRADGAVRGLCMIGPGETFCCLPALDGGHYPATAITGEETEYVEIPGETYRRWLQAYPDFARGSMQQLCGRLRENACDGCATHDDASARLAGKVLLLAKKFGEEIHVTRRELGELAGTTVETAIRNLREFEKSGWVELGRRRIRIRDRGALEEHAEGVSSSPPPAGTPPNL